jgi:hypothetical protein
LAIDSDSGFWCTRSNDEQLVIRVDVEGAESQVLEGAWKLVRQHAATWFVALHSSDQKQACLRLLADAGFTVSALNGELCDPASPDAVPDEIIATRR